MNTEDEHDELARILAMNDQDLPVQIAAQDLDCDTEVAELYEDAQMAHLEKALFGASLDNIMNLSDFLDLEARAVGVCQIRETNCEPVASTRSSSATREPINPIRTIRKPS
jgi:hypothetical protein